MAKNDTTDRPDESGYSRRQLVKYAGVGATFAAAGTMTGTGEAWADDTASRRPRSGSRGRR